MIGRWFAALARRGGWKDAGRTATRRPRRIAVGVAALEGRCTPTVTSVALVAVAPAPAATQGNTVLVSGMVTDSHPDAVDTANLTADYLVYDAAGQVVESGPVRLSSAGDGVSSFSFRIPPVPTIQGRRETIVITARDQDDVQAGRSVTTHANLVADPQPTPGQAVAAFGFNGTGGEFQGRGTGQVSVRKGTPGSVGIGGNGSFVLDGTSDVGLVQASGRGRFAVLADRLGAVGANASGKSSFRIDEAVIGGLAAEVQGSIRIDRGANSGLDFRAQGGFRPSAGSALGDVQGQGHGQIALSSDGEGHFSLGLKGQLAMEGDG